ncbi:MAG: putative lipid II flippase FtsW [Candidatus Omnitrophica bacterium]|jgi:cell division protein FtsW|nr:putative lipid II flippase FtsW [Candidatus Omnitrophota bacterium]MDD3274153.1 putative lipid II flippase FtsW [Candidatus Omnitrophota bacterium]MDD5077529.1 putative lipid II flippase FtsW [Candidatus Omnitrophota bacterium]MDD5724573.1 putative lipid II flippase FtsW [Candidatus Omnitrophota bacterium]
MVRTTRINLLTVSVILVCVGIVMIYSSSSIYAWERYGDSFYFLRRHLFFLFAGVALAFLAMIVDYHFLKKHAHHMIWLALALLVLVLVPGLGREVSGAQRWFRFKFISFQPSEFANLALIVYIADFISRKEDKIKMLLEGFTPAICMLGVVALLILLQPDLGTVIALSVVVLTMLFIAGARGKYILNLILCSLPALYFLVFSVPYRRARILAFLNPWLDPKGMGFQIIQSQIAIGSGGVFGRGLGHSQQKLFYLPAAHTDFIFSIIGEELGLLGNLGVIVLFLIFIQQGLKIIKNAQDRFGYFLALGLVLMISVKAIINIGVSCGIFPTKGLPLPFISYGGSSLIFDMVSLGILINIARGGEEYS